MFEELVNSKIRKVVDRDFQRKFGVISPKLKKGRTPIEDLDVNIVDFDPIPMTTNSMTYSISELNNAYYFLLDDLVFYNMKLKGVIGGTVGGYLDFDMPIKHVDGEVNLLSATIQESTLVAGLALTSSTSSVLTVSKYDASNFVAGDVHIALSGFYRRS